MSSSCGTRHESCPEFCSMQQAWQKERESNGWRNLMVVGMFGSRPDLNLLGWINVGLDGKRSVLGVMMCVACRAAARFRGDCNTHACKRAHKFTHVSLCIQAGIDKLQLQTHFCNEISMNIWLNLSMTCTIFLSQRSTLVFVDEKSQMFKSFFIPVSKTEAPVMITNRLKN